MVDYPTWNIKVVCDADVLRKLRDVLHSCGVLGKDWVRLTDKYISISTNKGHVKDLIVLMKDDDEKKWMESLCDDRTFPFIYNGIADRNPNPRYNYEEFRPGKQVAVKFTTHAINFQTKAKPSSTFNYNFRLYSLYLIDNDRPTVSTPSRRKQGPDEWLISLPRTRKTNIHINPLDWSL